MESEVVSFSLDTETAIIKNNNNSITYYDVDLGELLNPLLSKLPRENRTPRFEIKLRSITFNTPDANANSNVKLAIEGLDFNDAYDMTVKCTVNKAILGSFKMANAVAEPYVLNGSFENPQYPANTFGGVSTRPLDNWEFSTTGAVAIQNSNGVTAWSGTGGVPQDGNQVLIFQCGSNIGNNSFTATQDGILLDEGTYVFQGYFWLRQGSPAGQFYNNTITIAGQDIASFTIDTTQLTPQLITEIFTIETAGTYTLTIFTRTGNNTFINFSQFIDNISINKLDIQIQLLHGATAEFSVNRYGNLKKQLKMEIQDVATDGITNATLPEFKADFLVRYIR